MTDIRNDAPTEQAGSDLELVDRANTAVSDAKYCVRLANARLERARWHEAMAIVHVLIGLVVLALYTWGRL